MSKWYKIDNVGKVFHAVTEASNSSVYRVSVLMKDMVDEEGLQEALDSVIKRFPTLAVKVRKGVFWDFMESNEEKLSVQKETTYPCHPINPKENNGYLFKVLYFNKRIAVEIFHSLTDGTGAVEFLKTLIYQYLTLRGEEIAVDGDALLFSDQVPSKYETEDSFEKYYQKSNRNYLQDKVQRAFQIKGTPFDPKGVNVIHGVISASALNNVAKRMGVSITEFITALVIYAIYSETMKYGIYKENISIAIPVNLRQRFPSVTLRNFFSVVNVRVDINGDITLEEIMKAVSEQLKSKTDKQHLQDEINRHVQLQKSLKTRIVPLSLKYPAMRYGFTHYGEMAKTLTLTNLGNINLPDSMKGYIERMEVALYPTKNSPISCGVATVNDQMTITFARSIVESEVIKSFFSQLSRLTGLNVEVYSNNWGETR
ncbi:condensation domain-containing protein [Oceanobacillus manasiensis]|uniref:alcohol acetyltransferase n=1 Tax=Oceanobacillus manasiensis TaxID=586413 RepID=UPI0005A81B99|nr:alcohol acetyltransferase [Oceanobacillus manasiensis]